LPFFGVMLHGAPASEQAPTRPATAAAPDQQFLKADELDQLIAPIALYPDALLVEILMASTYPLEVVQADRWVRENKNLTGDVLKAAADKQDWDNSLKSLVATPSVLVMMSTKLDWTQKLGDAVLRQQPDAMDAVQRLRAKARAQNKLKTTKEQIVTVKQEQTKQVIVIEPAMPNTIYVPYYNPAVVYGAWPYPAYPPYYFPPPGYIAGAAIATGLAFGAGYAVGRWEATIRAGGVNWGGNNINVNRPVNINNTAVNNWQHKIRCTGAASLTTTRTCSSGSATTTFGPAVRRGWISAAAAVSRSCGPAAAVETSQTAPMWEAAPPERGPISGAAPPQEIDPISPAVAATMPISGAAPAGRGAIAPLAICSRGAWPTGTPPAAGQALVAVAVSQGEAGDGPISGSSTMSLFSAVSTMGLAFIASPIGAATRPMWESLRRRRKGSCRRRWGVAATTT
jgi:Protein of unknown function (DUF3300)